MIGIIDYGMGNIGSLTNALDSQKIPSVVTGNPGKLFQCNQLILPGVGAFKPAMEALNQSGLESVIHQWVVSGKPLLGICLGMQLLFTESEENGLTQGLNIITGKVTALQHSGRKVHMGWNEVEPVQPNSIITNKAYAYFVHSSACRPDDETLIIAKTNYGEYFVSAVQKANVFGVQFHPEKSQDFGMNILKKFAYEAL